MIFFPEKSLYIQASIDEHLESSKKRPKLSCYAVSQGVGRG